MIETIDPSLILNLDETGFGEQKGSKKESKTVLVPSDCPPNISFSEKRPNSHI